MQFYLFSLVVSDFELIRTRFILTGVLALVPIAVVGFLGLFVALLVWAVIHRFGKAGKWNSWRVLSTVVLAVAVLVVLSATTFWFLSETELRWEPTFTHYIFVNMLTLVIVVSGMLMIPVVLIIDSRDIAGQVERNRVLLWLLLFDLFWMTLLVAIGYLDFVANSVFPLVPEQLGGAKPREIELVLSGEGLEWGEETGLLENEKQATSKPLHLVWETGDTVVIRDPASSSDTVIQVNKSLIDAVVVHPLELELFPDRSEASSP